MSSVMFPWSSMRHVEIDTDEYPLAGRIEFTNRFHRRTSLQMKFTRVIARGSYLALLSASRHHGAAIFAPGAFPPRKGA